MLNPHPLRALPVLTLFLAAVTASAGPVEFGMSELQRAIAERGLNPARFRFQTVITTDDTDSFRVAPGQISGGSLRGVMYGLLEAAWQIRNTGSVRLTSGTPATAIRGVRQFIHNADLERQWYFSAGYWQDYFAMLARNRINRFTLVFGNETSYMAPPYPWWVELEAFPQVRVRGLEPEQRARNLEMLRAISQTASDFGVDFVLGIWSHAAPAGQPSLVEGLSSDNLRAYSYAALRRVLTACPAIRGVQVETGAASNISEQDQVSFFSEAVFRAVHESGRRLTLELRGSTLGPGMLEAARAESVPLRVSAKYWGDALGRPYQPAEAPAGSGYGRLLERPRPYEVLWELCAAGSHRLLLWGDPDYVRRAAPTFRVGGSTGFEIDVPQAQKGFGNAPLDVKLSGGAGDTVVADVGLGSWTVFTPAARNRISWKWDYERYWLFYLLWGRLSYDPATPDRVWLTELQRRFGNAAPDVLDGYRAASRVLSEIAAAGLTVPGREWSETSPGPALDAYGRNPTDGRLIAAVGADGESSVRQSPEQTAAILRSVAESLDRATERARSKLGDQSEWLSSEADFTVLAHLARFHSHKLQAAIHAARSEGGQARSEMQAAVQVWEALDRFTGGLYPRDMVYGPNCGHWSDRLPQVRADLQALEGRFGDAAAPAPGEAALSKPRPRPAVAHVPPRQAVPGQALPLAVRATPAAGIRAIRLHYRPLDQRSEFRTIEAKGGSANFSIPAVDLNPGFDLLYSFEVLHQDGGWLEPDPHATTPYWVVPVNLPAAPGSTPEPPPQPVPGRPEAAPSGVRVFSTEGAKTP